MDAGDTLIEAEGLCRRFGAMAAVTDLSLRVAPGEVLALLGPNGAGKTTTLQMLAALLSPTSGRARVAGFDVCAQASAVRARVGIMLDEPGFYAEMAVEDYLLFFARLYDIKPAQARPVIGALLERFGLATKRRVRLDALSKGMRQKVSLTRALLHEPPVLLLDEPTSALDPLSARAVQQYILERKAAGDAIIISTHNLPEAETVADRVAIVARGRLYKQGTPAALCRPRDDVESYALTLAGPPNGHTALLEGIAGLHGLALLTATDEEHTLTYHTSTPRRTNAAAVTALATHGAAVVGLSPRLRSLREVYLETMQEAERCA